MPVFSSKVPLGQFSNHGSRSKSPGMIARSLCASLIIASIRGAASDLSAHRMSAFAWLSWAPNASRLSIAHLLQLFFDLLHFAFSRREQKQHRFLGPGHYCSLSIDGPALPIPMQPFFPRV